MSKPKIQLTLFTKVLLASVLSYTIVGLDVALFSIVLDRNEILSPGAAIVVSIPLFFMFAMISIYITIRAFRIGDTRLAILYSIFWPLLLFILPFMLFSLLLIVFMVAAIMLIYELLFVHIHKPHPVQASDPQPIHARHIHSR